MDKIKVAGPILGGLPDTKTAWPIKKAYKPTIPKPRIMVKTVRQTHRAYLLKRRITVRPDIPITPDWSTEEAEQEIILRKRYRRETSQ